MKVLRQPWLFSVLAQVTLCRGMVIVAAILGLANTLGLSLFPCPFSAATGLPCAGCGITRSTVAWFRADWQLAMHYHPLSPGVLVFGGLITLSAFSTKRFREKIVMTVHAIERKTLLPTIFIIIFLVYGFLRMGGVCASGVEIKPSPFIELLEKRSKSSNVNL